MTPDGQEERTTRVIAGEIRRYRLKLGLSAQVLSDRTAERGLRVPRSVITNLENGHRDSISVAEWYVLGDALGVPPLSLLLPLGRRQFVDLPAGRMDTWDAYLHASGMEVPSSLFGPWIVRTEASEASFDASQRPFPDRL